MDISRINDEISRASDKNCFTFKNLDDVEQDMKEYLDMSSTICYYNCSNMDIIIKNRINKIVVRKCKNINFNIKSLVNGCHIENCESVSVRCSDDLNFFLVDKSFDIDVALTKKFYRKTKFEINKSAEVCVFDGHGNLLKNIQKN